MITQDQAEAQGDSRSSPGQAQPFQVEFYPPHNAVDPGRSVQPVYRPLEHRPSPFCVWCRGKGGLFGRRSLSLTEMAGYRVMYRSTIVREGAIRLQLVHGGVDGLQQPGKAAFWSAMAAVLHGKLRVQDLQVGAGGHAGLSGFVIDDYGIHLTVHQSSKRPQRQLLQAAWSPAIAAVLRGAGAVDVAGGGLLQPIISALGQIVPSFNGSPP